MPTRRLEVAIVGDTKSLERAYDRANRKSSAFGKSFGKLGKAGAAGVAAGGAYLVGKQLLGATRAALDAEKAQTRLTGAFKSAGVGQKQYAAAQARISKVSKAAAIDDEDLSDSLAKLTRTSGSAAKGMKGMELAANIARARNISLEAATKIVEKAMTGQFRGMKAVGVEVKKNATTTQVLEAAQKKFAGSAAAYGKTAAGAQDKLSVAFENLQERVGAKLLPILTRLSLKLIDLIDWSERNWPKFAAAVQQVYAKAKPVIDNLIARFRDIAGVFKGVVKIIQGIANGEWSQVWAGIKQVVVNQVKLIYHTFLELPKKIATALGKKAWSGLKAVGGYIGEAIESGLKAVLRRALALVQKFLDLLKPVSGVLGKVGIDVKVPQVGKLLDDKPKPRAAPGSGLRRGGVGSRPDEGTRGLQGRGTPIIVQMDGREVGRGLLPYQQREGKGNAPQTRGRNPGRQMGLA